MQIVQVEIKSTYDRSDAINKLRTAIVVATNRPAIDKLACSINAAPQKTSVQTVIGKITSKIKSFGRR